MEQGLEQNLIILSQITEHVDHTQSSMTQPMTSHMFSTSLFDGSNVMCIAVEKLE